MAFEVSVARILGKHDDPERCEDVLVADGPLYAAIDGATDKDGLTYEWQGREVSGAKFAAQVLAEAVPLLDTEKGCEGTIEELAGVLRSRVSAQYPDLPSWLYPSASISIFDPEREIVWGVGDGHVGLSFPGDGHIDPAVEVHQERKHIDEVTSDARAAYLTALGLQGMPWNREGKDLGREFIYPLLNVQTALANTTGEFGFGLLNGTPVPSEHIWVISTLFADKVVLASDGYPLIAVGGNLDLEAAEAYLSEALDRDPQCVSLLRSTKGLVSGQISFDDRSWLELTRTR